MMNFRKFSAVAVIALTTVCVGAQAQTSNWTIDTAHSSAQFTIRHGGVSNVHGSITGVKGLLMLNEKDITKSSVVATLDTTTVNTSQAARDTHLKTDSFFGVEKNPTMTFKSTSIVRVGGKLQMLGNLTINGVTKPVTLDLDGPATPVTSQTKAGPKVVSGFSASGVIKRSDFNFGSAFPAPLLGDEVKLEIDVEIDKQ
jgi:polyisoprenoid-binding protein YceI